MAGLNKQSEYKAKNNEICLFPSCTLRTAESGIPPLTWDSYRNFCLQATVLHADPDCIVRALYSSALYFRMRLKVLKRTAFPLHAKCASFVWYKARMQPVLKMIE